jgi:dienelactone hydrolase
VLLIVVVGAAGCASLAGDASDTARTFDSARLYIPGNPTALTMNTPAVADSLARQSLPALVYLHGCTGITPHDEGWARLVSAQGYVVILVDSFARKYRPSDCDPKTNTFGTFERAHDMRQEEIEYARAKLRTVSWVDQRNVFLMGHSEGGVATARWSGSGYAGYIVSGWACTSPASSFNGLWTPRDVPVLVIRWRSDPWRSPRYDGSCADHFGRRKNAREVALVGQGHGTLSSAEAREAVLQFLQQYTVK